MRHDAPLHRGCAVTAKLCIGCRWWKDNTTRSFDICECPATQWPEKVEPVRGETVRTPRYCETERLSPIGACGEAGKCWEARA